MGILIDTSIIIHWERGNREVQSYAEKHKNEDFFLSVISASELLHGVHRAKNQAIRRKRSAYVEAILSAVPILPIDLPIARLHAEISASLANKGAGVGAHDLWIAATAISCGYLLVTNNIKDFKKISGLQVESWG